MQPDVLKHPGREQASSREGELVSLLWLSLASARQASLNQQAPGCPCSLRVLIVALISVALAGFKLSMCFRASWS